jgi:poly(A) polymerase
MRLPELESADISYRFLGATALNHFFRLPQSPVLYAAADTDLTQLATLYDDPTFPGHPAWDLVVKSGGRDVFIKEEDGFAAHRRDPLSEFSWDPLRRAFHDPMGLYPLLKEARTRLKVKSFSDNVPVGLDEFPHLGEMIGSLDAPVAAVVAARFPIRPMPSSVRPWSPDPTLPPVFHRNVLTEIISGPWPARGLEILRRTGYLADILPDLDALNRVEHSKEGHPEGNAWKHTLETYSYRKTRDLTVGLALLFHDIGKAISRPNGARRFDGHADIGANRAVQILRGLTFTEEMISAVRWLIRYHMIPGALLRLPDHRRDPIMASPLFPLLLEVYRCDLSSTFRGPENYYAACTIYRRFLKTRRRRELYPSRKLVATYLE